MRILVALALGMALLSPRLASAAPDQTLAATEFFSIINATDGVQTQTWRNGGQFDCKYGVYGFTGPGVCTPVEITPFARGFVNRGWVGQAEATGLSQAPIWAITSLARGGLRRTWGHLLRMVDGVYVGAFIYPNQRIIYGQIQFKK